MPFTLPQVAALVSVVAGMPVAIACDITPQEPYDGFVAFPDWIHPEHLIHLKNGVCVRLMRSAESPSLDPEDFLLLEHEAMHIRLASLDECLTERTALANIFSLVRLFRLAAWRTTAILVGAVAADAYWAPEYHPDPVTGAC